MAKLGVCVCVEKKKVISLGSGGYLKSFSDGIDGLLVDEEAVVRGFR